MRRGARGRVQQPIVGMMADFRRAALMPGRRTRSGSARRGRRRVEVVALGEVLDQTGLDRLPAEEVAGQRGRRRVVDLGVGTEEAEVVIGLGLRDADDGQVQPAADGLGDLPEADPLVVDSVQP